MALLSIGVRLEHVVIALGVVKGRSDRREGGTDRGQYSNVYRACEAASNYET